jgi:patatin-like phospholipase/acyl hydrolase
MTKTFVLACDGGGVRGYITASVLKRLAGSSGAGNFLPRVTLNAGTSTGSFISLALAAGVTIDTIQTRYQQANAAVIFTPNPNISAVSAGERAGVLEAIRAKAASLGGIWDDLLRYFAYFTNASYTNTGVMEVAQQLLGKDTPLSKLRPVLVNTLQLDDTTATLAGWAPLTITNTGGSRYAGMAAWEAALCSGAAPIYFPPFKPKTMKLGYCADGGLFANNPSLSAIASARSQGVALGDLYVLSLDTGTTADGMSASVIDGWGGGLSMGPAQWLFPLAQTEGGTTTPKFPLLSALMDSSSSAITQQSAMLLGANYFRVTVPLTGPVALDDTSTAAYATMDASLETYYASPAFTAAVTWLKTHFPS